MMLTQSLIDVRMEWADALALAQEYDGGAGETGRNIGDAVGIVRRSTLTLGWGGSADGRQQHRGRRRRRRCE